MQTKEQQIAAQFEILDDQIAQGRIRVKSNKESLDDKLFTLNSEDAKTLALRFAVERNYSSPYLKHAYIEYCDPETLQPYRHVLRMMHNDAAEPVLVVHFHSDTFAIGDFSGDSLQ